MPSIIEELYNNADYKRRLPDSNESDFMKYWKEIFVTERRDTMKPKLSKELFYIRTDKGLYGVSGYTFETEYAGYDHVFKIGLQKERGKWLLTDCDTGMRLNAIAYETRQKAIDAYFDVYGAKLLNLYLASPMNENYYSRIRNEFSEMLEDLKRQASDNHLIIYQARKVVDPFALELEFSIYGKDSIYYDAILHHVDIRTKSKSARFSGDGEDILHVIDLICRNLRTYDGLDFETSDEVQIENEVTKFLVERF